MHAVVLALEQSSIENVTWQGRKRCVREREREREKEKEREREKETYSQKKIKEKRER